MGYVIERTDGTTDGLGDRIVFLGLGEAQNAAANAFGRDPAGNLPSWLKFKWVDEEPMTDGRGNVIR